jgi:hypothetical protein
MHQSHPESRIAMPGRSLFVAADADAGATEVTMVSVSAATTAPSHFFAEGDFMTGNSSGSSSGGGWPVASLTGHDHCGQADDPRATIQGRE